MWAVPLRPTSWGNNMNMRTSSNQQVLKKVTFF